VEYSPAISLSATFQLQKQISNKGKFIRHGIEIWGYQNNPLIKFLNFSTENI